MISLVGNCPLSLCQKFQQFWSIKNRWKIKYCRCRKRECIKGMSYEGKKVCCCGSGGGILIAYCLNTQLKNKVSELVIVILGMTNIIFMGFPSLQLAIRSLLGQVCNQ